MADIKNLEVRMKIFESGLNHWEVADKLGVSATTFSRWLRTELPPTKKKEILMAVNELGQEAR